MGQVIESMPDTWQALIEEKDRVLQWSGEVLSKIADSINVEEFFEINYSDEKIDEKIESWIQTNRERIDEILSKYPEASQEIANEIAKITDDLKVKVRKEYENAYENVKKLAKKIEELREEQRHVQDEIQDLESSCDGDMKSFMKKFAPLQAKTLNHLKTGEKLMLQSKKLITDFANRVVNIDRKNLDECSKKINKLLNDLERSVSK